MRAIEFFSGIGAFAEAARSFGIDVLAAYDQNQVANASYQHNFGLKPISRNLDTLPMEEIPQADLWWMSPPCTPYSVRGRRRDAEDPRARSLLHLIDTACILQPGLIAIENVMGFAGSQTESILLDRLRMIGYEAASWNLCSTQFGVPMRRPRRFTILGRGISPPGPTTDAISMRPLSEFLFDDSVYLYLDHTVLERYERGFDIVDATNPAATLICFTKNYARCMKASGSLLRTSRGVRRVSPEEILGLLGFNSSYRFPDDVEPEWRWRLVGNSVDVRAITFLLQQICTGLCQDMGVSRSRRNQA